MNARDKAIAVLIALSAAGVLPASSGFLHAQAVPDAEAEVPARIIFEGATVIDGTGAPPQTGMAIVLEGEEIVAVLPAGDLGAERRDGAEVVDASSWYAIPGLIESHTHVATMANRARAEFILNRQLYGGITTARDMAGDVRSLMDLQRASLVKEIDAPDLRFAALMAGPDFFTDPRTVSSAAGETPGAVTWMQAVTEETDLREAVTLARGTWATGIKTYAAIDGDLLAAIAAEARRQGIPVWAHVHVGPARALEVARAGVRAMSHVCDVGSAAIPDDVFQEGQEGLRSGFVDVDLDDPAIDSVFAVDEAERHGPGRHVADCGADRAAAHGGEWTRSEPSDRPRPVTVPERAALVPPATAPAPARARPPVHHRSTAAAAACAQGARPRTRWL